MQQPSFFQFETPAPRRLGYLGMIGLLVLAGVFYRERAWMLDIAFQTFLMINDGTVQVMVNRFGSALVQLLPLSAIKLGAPVEVISLLYSVSFPLLFLMFYTVTVRVLRNDFLGWAIVLLYTLIVYDAFYWATSEQQQGLGAVLVFFAYWLRYPRQEKPWMWALSAFSVVALAYYHPLIFISFYFLWAYFGLHFRAKIQGWAYWALAGFMAIVQGAKSWLSANWYDNAKYSSFSDNLWKYFPNYFDLPAHGKFLSNALTIWYGFPLLLLALTLFYVYRRHWLKLGLVWLTCFGYLMLLHIGSPESEHRFYVEVNYMALSIFVGVPFLFEMAPLMKKQQRAYLLAGLLAFRLVAIALHHKPFEARWRWVEQAIATPETGNRFYLTEREAPMDTLLMSWGVPYESLLISNAQTNGQQVRTLLVHPDLKPFEKELKQDSVFITPFKTYPAEALNPDYFPIGDGLYKSLPADK
ncbi:MAG: hypothetical protein RIC19_16325 [Phaeodactylibacter sp.]|uniref:hypothetical protein n=1 Tax=Phaeodactylibacter sp. TaxID=1940289 RepID=UPI0032EBFADF